jgi:hypothetical protein
VSIIRDREEKCKEELVVDSWWEDSVHARFVKPSVRFAVSSLRKGSLGGALDIVVIMGKKPRNWG